MLLDNTYPSIPIRFFGPQFPPIDSLVNFRILDTPNNSQSFFSAETTQLGFDTSSLLVPCLLLLVTEKFQRDTNDFGLQHHMQVVGTLWYIHGDKPLVRLHIVSRQPDPSLREDIEDSSRGILYGFPKHQNGPFGSKSHARDRHNGVRHTILKLNLSFVRNVRSQLPHNTQFHFYISHVHEGDISITLQTSHEMERAVTRIPLCPHHQHT